MAESGAGHADTSARTGATMLHEAATHGALHVTRYLLSFVEANFPLETCTRLVSSVDTCYSHTTPLLAACQSSNGLMTQRLEIVRLLVAAQADVDHQDARGDNVLHWCARDSHVVLLSFFLNETEASVNATFAENYKRDKPLDIEKRQLSRAPSMTTTTAFNLLRHVDRKCNIRMKMQALKRYHTAQQSSIDVHESETLQTALDTTNAALKRVEHVWTHAIQQAEANRQHAEDTHVASAVAAASRAAVDWFNTKDGKAHVKKQLTDATADIKRDVQTGKLVKPKDLKVAAVERVQDTYRREQEAATRRAAIERFHVKTALPTYPLDATPATLAAALCLLHTS